MAIDAETSVDRVLYDDVEFHDQQALVNAQPFTGIIFWLHPDGTLAGERAYRDGLPEGEQLSWYANGQLRSRAVAVWNRGSSEASEWYENGQPKSFRRDVNGQWVELKKWDDEGVLVQHDQRDAS